MNEFQMILLGVFVAMVGFLIYSFLKSRHDALDQKERSQRSSLHDLDGDNENEIFVGLSDDGDFGISDLSKTDDGQTDMFVNDLEQSGKSVDVEIETMNFYIMILAPPSIMNYHLEYLVDVLDAFGFVLMEETMDFARLTETGQVAYSVRNAEGQGEFIFMGEHPGDTPPSRGVTFSVDLPQPGLQSSQVINQMIDDAAAFANEINGYLYHSGSSGPKRLAQLDFDRMIEEASHL